MIMCMDSIQLFIGIGQILAVAIIPIIIWIGGIKYQNRKAKRDAQLQLFLTLFSYFLLLWQTERLHLSQKNGWMP